MTQNSTLLTLKCWTCGEKIPIDGVSTTGNSGVDEKLRRYWAQQLGWVLGRAKGQGEDLLFCCKDCERDAKKPNGSFKKHSPAGEMKILIPNQQKEKD